MKSKNGTFTALQMKSFDPKKIKVHAGVKKCHFGNFIEKGWDGRALLVWKIPHRISKILFVLVSYELLAMLEGKIGETPRFNLVK